MFRWPHVRELWRSYLKGFVDRYGGAKLERARDLFEQALRGAPPADAAGLYVDYAKLEEAHGLARRAMAVCERAATTADDDRAFAAWRLYAAKVERAFGAPKARGVYERAVKKLAKDDDAKRMCLAFSQLERGLGEVDRARAILAHGSQFADPRLDDHYWQSWRDFEARRPRAGPRPPSSLFASAALSASRPRTRRRGIIRVAAADSSPRSRLHGMIRVAAADSSPRHYPRRGVAGGLVSRGLSASRRRRRTCLYGLSASRDAVLSKDVASRDRDGFSVARRCSTATRTRSARCCASNGRWRRRGPPRTTARTRY